ncbi:hypothetical protein ACFSTA_13670 [Ornithinibacillus salinisoli]|uniref:Uncharacterized protein n=1 Tax=Ornithinibacillus salinisoli TaxID=1848459 RepID=A0ABW4W234_9BACI
MDEKQQFIRLLKVTKRKLIMNQAIRSIHVGLLIMAIAIVLMTLLARMVVIVHLLEKMLFLSTFILLITIVYIIIKRPTNRSAANLFDEYVRDDRVITALNYLYDESAISHLQRRDAIVHMNKVKITIEHEKSKVFYWKQLIFVLFLFSVSIGSLLLPNEVMQTAEQLELDEEIVEKAKGEIEKLVEEDNKVDEIQKELLEETQDVKESEELLEKLLKQEEKLVKEKVNALNEENKLKELANGVNELQELSSALEQLDTEKLNDALNKLMENELSALSEQQQKALEELISAVTNQEIGNLSELSQEQLNEIMSALGNQLGAMIENANSIPQLTNLQEQVQNIASTLNENRNANGLSNSNELAFGSSSQSNNQHSENPSDNNGSSSQGQGQSSGDGNGSGSGNGDGNGSGNGSGNGNGSGSGNGSGNGSGSNGNGAGFGQGSRELTIPEEIEGENTIETDNGELGEGNSEQQTAPNAPILKGSIRSYDEVYGNYEKAYRNGIERMDLPTYLEDVVKGYFSDLDPRGE